MPVFAFILFTVLSCYENADGTVLDFAELFHEELEIAVIELRRAEVFVGIGKRDKARFFVHLGFVNAPSRPAKRVVEPAFEAVATRQFERDILLVPGLPAISDLTVPIEGNGARLEAGQCFMSL